MFLFKQGVGLKAQITNLLYQRDTQIEPSLDGIKLLAAKLDNPQNNFKSIQIGGTNGKSSTTHFLSLILMEQGLKVGRYTSPHLESFSERIAINNKNISIKKLEAQLVEMLEIINEAEVELNRKLTGFEILTAVAFKYFNDNKVDVAVLEVGMGGKWDATSIVNPAVCAITNVEMDHMDYLGDTKEKIAKEKIGIVKDSSPLVTSETDKKIIEIFKKHCAQKKSKIYFADKGAAPPTAGLPPTKLPLLGDYQHANMANAIKAAEIFLKQPLKQDKTGKVFKEINLGGRFEVLNRSPLVILDGAHNPAAANLLADEIKKTGARKKRMIIGVLSDKDVNGIIRPLIKVFDEIMVTENLYERSLPAEELLKTVNCQPLKGSIKIHLNKSLKDSIIDILEKSNKKDLICITGSLYTVGQARATLKKILNK